MEDGSDAVQMADLIFRLKAACAEGYYKIDEPALHGRRHKTTCRECSLWINGFCRLQSRTHHPKDTTCAFFCERHRLNIGRRITHRLALKQ